MRLNIKIARSMPMQFTQVRVYTLRFHVQCLQKKLLRLKISAA